ncbi:MAG: glutathione synthase, partial [Candidatus Eisenbacteria bacterium]
MKIGLLVNDIKTEETGYTSSRLGVTAVNMGHEIWVMGVGDLAYDPDDVIRARARTVPKKKYTTSEGYLRDLQGKSAVSKRISVEELDVLLLRNDP